MNRPPTKPLTVSQLTARVKNRLEDAFPDVWVAGEISNFTRSGAGHCYFTLKDDAAQLRAVIWQSTAQWIRFQLQDGLKVVCRGGLEVYAPRGAYQLIVQQVQPKGEGALDLALRQLREKLQAEGLFDPALKRPLPRFPRQVAVVTSPSGAAIRDFLQVLRRRWRGTDVLLVPVRVQGEGAGLEIAAAIATVNRLRRKPDCLVVTRGGGSLEDLWAFNEEPVVRAIHASQIPVVSAVGHEIDVTLADLAADVRALTPSEAAERVVPDGREVARLLAQRGHRLGQALRSQAAAARRRLEGVSARRVFQQPQRMLHELAQTLDDLQARASRSAGQQLSGRRSRVESLSARLEALSPLAVLARGYSVTQRADGRVIRSSGDVAPGDEIVTRLADGRVQSRVEQVRPGRDGETEG